jgi:uncharacterized protein YciI
MFLISITYVKPIEEIEQHLAAHNAWLDKYYLSNDFIASGRKIPRTGGIILVKAASKSILNDMIKSEPFYVAKLATYEILEFRVTKTNNKGIDLE